MFPHPECTKMPRTNNNLSNTVDFLRPMISNPSIPIYNNHESYTFDKNSFLNNMDIERNMQSSRIDRNNKPIQSHMQSSYQFFNNNMLTNQQVNNDDTFFQMRNPVNTRRDSMEKTRSSDTQQFLSHQGGPINNFADIRYTNTRQDKKNINVSSYIPMARTLAIPKENI